MYFISVLSYSSLPNSPEKIFSKNPFSSSCGFVLTDGASGSGTSGVASGSGGVSFPSVLSTSGLSGSIGLGSEAVGF